MSRLDQGMTDSRPDGETTLRGLRSFSQFLLDRRPLEEVMEAAADACANGLPGGVVRVWRTAPTRECLSCPSPDACSARLACLHLVVSRGVVVDFDDELCSIPLGSGLVGMTAQEKREVVAPSVATVDSVLGRAWAKRHGLHVFNGFPLLANGRMYGVLGVWLDRRLAEDAWKNIRTISHILAQAVNADSLTRERERHAGALATKLEAQTNELRERVSDLEDTRSAMVNMMADALESHRQLREMASSLEEQVVDRTKEAVAAKEEAERANHAKSSFLSRVSHELRTPMHGIMSFAKVGLRKIEKSDADKNRYYFNQIIESADELLPLINDLLDLSKIEAGCSSYEFKPHKIRDLLAVKADKFVVTFRERGLELDVDIDLDDDLECVLDGNHLRQVITNLLGNAMKFTHPGTTVTVAAFREGEMVVLEVRDRGDGVPADELEKIFETFTRSSTSGDYEGTGLGLPIARGIARDHGGDIVAFNRLDGGAVFRLMLPIEGPVPAPVRS